MAATGVYGLRYRLLNDTPDIAAGTQNLAEDVEAEVVRVDGLVSDINAREGAAAGICGNISPGSLTTTAAYANMPTPSSVTITKQETTTRLKVEMHVTCASNAINTIAFFGVLVGGVDRDVCNSPFRGSALITQHSSGVLYVPAGVAAGIVTVQARWKRTFGAGTVSTDGNDRLALSVQEVL